MKSEKQKKEKSRKYYLENLERLLSKRKERYNKDKDAVKAGASAYRKERRRVNLVKERTACRHNTKQFYDRNLEQSRALSRRSIKERYDRDVEQSRALSRRSTKERYDTDVEQSRALSRRST